MATMLWDQVPACVEGFDRGEGRRVVGWSERMEVRKRNEVGSHKEVEEGGAARANVACVRLGCFTVEGSAGERAALVAGSTRTSCHPKKMLASCASSVACSQ